MNILDRAFSDMFSEKRASSNSGKSVMNDFFGFFGTGIKGKNVNYKNALRLSAVYNAVDQISNSNAIIPYGAYKKTVEGRERLYTHPVDRLLSSEPDGSDGYMTAFVFKKLATVSVLLRGNALFRIKTERSGNQKLKYIPWDDVADIRNADGKLVYIIKDGTRLLADEVLHFKGFSLNGIVGISVISYAAIQMGMALEVQEFSATSIANKGVRTGVVETEKAVTEGKGKIIEGWKNAMQAAGPDRVVVLDDGLKFKPITITPQEAQIIEMARFGVEDIARWFNIALHKIKSMQASTNNNIEQQTIDYSTDTMLPHVTNFEQEFAKKLYTESEKQQGYFIKGNMNVLLRADSNSRANYYAKAINFGWATRNEVRSLEELNSLPGLDDPLTPANTLTMEQIDANLKQLEQ
ncbi:hypothetical protein ASG38_15030 [Flavobacterium sp. Leaf359]|uniref:phage portal protein n=1 Tax=Flavobacterium sp. Leaf359 TaxID=1736351 RepID=UPI0006FBE9DC|nr:phage portal protein [Flavobacterium sp. Leaf359]KQS45921.1 hypothetical protein ASG38_15030 [Flavobacterium sp. Leaf359]